MTCYRCIIIKRAVLASLSTAIGAIPYSVLMTNTIKIDDFDRNIYVAIKATH